MKKFKIEMTLNVSSKGYVNASSEEEAEQIFLDELMKSKHLVYKVENALITSDVKEDQE